ncbi:MAG: ABC transporter substrate-binding protein [Elainella sp. Prado103]|jgi:branched-chain amino acid transport system substrate-binding protein/neutral amino acid transport system substrate-binding protein|nr:ABC transporter substrate-binding protein [Elainella sp. Prado103]
MSIDSPFLHRVRRVLRIQSIAPLLVWGLTGCTTAPLSLNLPDQFPPQGFPPPGFPPEGFPVLAESPPEVTENLPPEQLRLGLLLSLSGGLAKQGEFMQDSARLLVETSNRCKGVVGQAVQLFSVDDQASAVGGQAGMTQLIEEARVGAVIGAIGSEVSNAAVNLAVKNQVVQISPASANSVLTTRSRNGELQGFWYRTMPPDTAQGEALAKVAQQRGFKTVSILAINNDYGNSIAQAFETSFKQLGGTSTYVDRYSPDAVAYDVNWIPAFSANPDAVLIVAEPRVGSEILTAAAALGYWGGNTKVLLTSSMKTETLAEQVGRSIDGRYLASGVIGVAPKMDSPALSQFRELYRKQYGRDPSLYDANTWDAAAVIVLAAEAAQDTTGSAIKTKIPQIANPPGIEVSDLCQGLALVREGKEINYQGASGATDFNAAGDVIGTYDVWTIDYMGKIKVESHIESD